MDVGVLIGTAIDTLEAGMTDVATPALALGATVLALTVGWKFAKRFVKG